jgi:hypothetical protein
MAVDVHDAVNRIYLGRLVNIHQEGLMILGGEQLPHNNLYQLELQLSQPINGHDHIALGVDCIWSRRDEESTMFWAGCKVIDISDEALMDLAALIELIKQ